MASTLVDITCDAGKWTLLYTFALGTEVIEVQNKHPVLNLLLRLGAATDPIDAPAAIFKPFAASSPRAVAAGDQLYAMPQCSPTGPSTVVLVEMP